MLVRQAVVSWAVLCFVAWPITVLGDESSSGALAFAHGLSLLAKGDFDNALDAFAGAAKADPDNAEYGQQYAMLRQVIRLRRDFDRQRDPVQWQNNAQAMRSFYVEHNLWNEALPLDRAVHDRLRTPDTAARLGESLLALGANSEAAEMLAALPEGQASTRTRALQGIALARTGRLDDAKALTQQCTPAEDAGADTFGDVARLHSLLGNADRALAMLVRYCQMTPPSQLERARARIKACPDFAALASSAEFTKALATESTIKESGCSSGTGCGNCPSRTKCGAPAGGPAAPCGSPPKP